MLTVDSLGDINRQKMEIYAKNAKKEQFSALHYIRNRKQFKFHNPENQNERRRPKCKRKTSALWGKLSIQQNIFVTN